jgi:cyclohexanone monooxygenase
VTERTEVAVLGAGFGGLAMAHALAEVGISDLVIFERNEGVGGTWLANSYPGAACDVPSHLYSLSYAPNPDWSRTYAGQVEILAYIEDCYERFGAIDKVRTSTTIVAARWQEEDRCWRLTDQQGRCYEAAFLVSAIGLFHTPSMPDIAGMDEFAGASFHSARWDHAENVAGRRVAVVGTGASAIQIVPAIADEAAQVVLFQRTPPWIVPRRDQPFTDEQRRTFAAEPEVARRLRDETHLLFESNLSFLRGDPSADFLSQMASDHLDRKVADPVLRDRLRPDYPVGCKRTLVSSAFYPAMQRDDVELVTEPIERITPDGIRTTDGREWPCDIIVWSTGFRASEYLRGIEIRGRAQKDLQERWAGVPRAYHGMAVPGFPNFFMLYGPNTNQGGNSILLMLEAQASFVAGVLSAAAADGVRTVEVTESALASYTAALLDRMDDTVWAEGCDSYFRAASGDVVTQIPHTSTWYRERLEQADPDDFIRR